MKNTKATNSADIYTQIAALDGKWNNDLLHFMEDGNLPTKENARATKFMFAMLALTGLFVMFVNPNDSLLVICLGFLLFVLGTFLSLKKNDSLGKFNEAKDEYENTRTELLVKIK